MRNSQIRSYFGVWTPVTLLLALIAAPEPVIAQGRVTRTTHPWGQFGPQSWSLVRKVSETFDEQGKTAGTTVTETKTTLLAVDDDTYTVKIESTVEVAGKKIVAEPKVVRQTYEDLALDVNVMFRVLNGDQPLEVEDRRVTCQAYEVSYSSTLQKTSTKTYFCGNVAPYVLRRETTTVNATNGNTESQTVQAVVSLDMPFKVVSENKSTVHFRVNQKYPAGSTTSLLIHCPEVPGGLVSQSSKELDGRSRVIRRSTVELIDYSVKPAVIARQTTSQGASFRRRGLFRHRHYYVAQDCEIAANEVVAYSCR